MSMSKMGSVLRNSTIVIHANVIFIESNIHLAVFFEFYFTSKFAKYIYACNF